MSIGNPFDEPGEWYRANLHTHSTLSDGMKTPPEVVAWYREHGYQILALTDHNTMAESVLLDEGKFLLLGGIEVDGMDPQTGLYHLVGLAPRGSVDCHAGQHIPAQAAVERVRSTGAAVLLAHPYWSSTMSKDMLGLEGVFGLEVYNGGCEVVNGKGYSTVHWDDMLAAGRKAWGVAADDTHWWPGYPDAGLGWVQIKAQALSPEAVLAALEQGRFYASTGPEIHDFCTISGHAHVRCSPVKIIDFIGAGRHSLRVTAPAGGCVTEASYALAPAERQRYVRVTCGDGTGGWAWSNPLFVD